MIRILLTLALCLPLLTPGIANAKKPSLPESTCTLFVWPEAPLTPGQLFSVKVIKIPSYPSAWRNPTITIDVTYPGMTPDGFYQQTIPSFYVTYWEAPFQVPESGVGITAGDIIINATIDEPIRKKNNNSPNYTPTFKTTRCETTTTVELP